MSITTESETKPKQYRRTHPEMPLDSWVEDRKNKDCVRFYKSKMSLSSKYPQLRSDGFFLLMQTKPQLDLMKKHCERLVCIDKQTSRTYEVLTLIIIDNLGHSFPCASVFTDKIDQSVVEVYFTEIKSEIGNVNVKLLMVGKDQFISDTWNQVIGQPEKLILNSWEILEEWKTKLNNLVENKIKQSVMFKQLKTILNEPDKKIFTTNLNQWVSESLVDLETAQFALYISGNYIHNPSCWAPCFNNEESLNLNYQVEIMHERFKHVFKDKTTKRLDRALSNILQYLRSKVYDRLLLMSGGKNKLFNLSQKHNLAQKYIFKIIQKDSYWTVFTLTGKKDKQKIRFWDKDCKCVQKCHSCKVCSHVYTCSCPDSNVRLNMCRHIHGLCTQLAAGNIEHSTSDSDESDLEIKEIKKSGGQELFLNTETEDDVACQNLYPVDELLQYEVVYIDGTEITVPYHSSHCVPSIDDYSAETFQVDVQDTEQITSESLSLESMKLHLENMFKTVLSSASDKKQLQEIEKALYVLQGKIQGVKPQGKSRKRPSSNAKAANSHLQGVKQEGCRKIQKLNN